MPETVQTPPAPITHPPVTPAPAAPAAPTPHAAATGIHAAVQITLSCEIASMQLTPNFKMGALQLRPVSKLVTMGLLSAPSGQSGMNLHAAFEIDRIEPAQGSLGRIRLTPAQQGQQQQQQGQQGGSRTAPSFNISGLQVVAASEAAPLQLTPSQQGQTSVRLTAMCHISAVEFSPTFDIGAMVLNATSNTVSVQLPGAAAQMENGPVFEIANVQVNNDGDITMLQLNPAGSRRG